MLIDLSIQQEQHKQGFQDGSQGGHFDRNSGMHCLIWAFFNSSRCS